MRGLDGAMAIVTGGGGNIGSAICHRLAVEGARVVAADVDGQAAEAVALGSGHDIVGLRVDVTATPEVDRLVEQTVERFGRLDLLVNAAALLGRTRFADITDELWDRYLDVNVSGAFRCCRAAARCWETTGTTGSIINVCSVESAVAFPDQVHYATTKGALLMMTRALALDLSPIRVNAVGPGTVERPDRVLEPERRAAYEGLHPIGRLGRAEDVAGVVAFLASDDAAWMTGEIVYVDGGFLIR